MTTRRAIALISLFLLTHAQTCAPGFAWTPGSPSSTVTLFRDNKLLNFGNAWTAFSALFTCAESAMNQANSALTTLGLATIPPTCTLPARTFTGSSLTLQSVWQVEFNLLIGPFLLDAITMVSCQTGRMAQVMTLFASYANTAPSLSRHEAIANASAAAAATAVSNLQSSVTTLTDSLALLSSSVAAGFSATSTALTDASVLAVANSMAISLEMDLLTVMNATQTSSLDLLANVSEITLATSSVVTSIQNALGDGYPDSKLFANLSAHLTAQSVQLSTLLLGVNESQVSLSAVNERLGALSLVSEVVSRSLCKVRAYAMYAVVGMTGFALAPTAMVSSLPVSVPLAPNGWLPAGNVAIIRGTLRVTLSRGTAGTCVFTANRAPGSLVLGDTTLPCVGVVCQ